MRLTIYHDDQFWVGVVEVVRNGKLKAGRYVFGAEPNDQEILDFVNRFVLNFTSGLSQEVVSNRTTAARVNPKRMARQISREIQQKGISTKAQEAIKLEYENRKKERREFTRQKREEIKERKREIARRKAKDKHRGR